jgi:hypothetical protein
MKTTITKSQYDIVRRISTIENAVTSAISFLHQEYKSGYEKKPENFGIYEGAITNLVYPLFKNKFPDIKCTRLDLLIIMGEFNSKLRQAYKELRKLKTT